MKAFHSASWPPGIIAQELAGTEKRILMTKTEEVQPAGPDSHHSRA